MRKLEGNRWLFTAGLWTILSFCKVNNISGLDMRIVGRWLTIPGQAKRIMDRLDLVLCGHSYHLFRNMPRLSDYYHSYNHRQFPFLLSYIKYSSCVLWSERGERGMICTVKVEDFHVCRFLQGVARV